MDFCAMRLPFWAVGLPLESAVTNEGMEVGISAVAVQRTSESVLTTLKSRPSALFVDHSRVQEHWGAAI